MGLWTLGGLHRSPAEIVPATCETGRGDMRGGGIRARGCGAGCGCTRLAVIRDVSLERYLNRYHGSTLPTHGNRRRPPRLDHRISAACAAGTEWGLSPPAISICMTGTHRPAYVLMAPDCGVVAGTMDHRITGLLHPDGRGGSEGGVLVGERRLHERVYHSHNTKSKPSRSWPGRHARRALGIAFGQQLRRDTSPTAVDGRAVHAASVARLALSETIIPRSWTRVRLESGTRAQGSSLAQGAGLPCRRSSPQLRVRGRLRGRHGCVNCFFVSFCS